MYFIIRTYSGSPTSGWGMLLNEWYPCGVSIVILNLALNSGSSKQGKALLACVGSNLLAASHLQAQVRISTIPLLICTITSLTFWSLQYWSTVHVHFVSRIALDALNTTVNLFTITLTTCFGPPTHVVKVILNKWMFVFDWICCGSFYLKHNRDELKWKVTFFFLVWTTTVVVNGGQTAIVCEL